MKTSLTFLGTSLAMLLAAPAGAGVFIFAESQTNPNLIAHPTGYIGSGGTLTVSVCIATDSESIADMEIPVQNVISVWNALDPVLGNITLNDSQLASNEIDYESVLLHEVGHCIGLAHPNLASESGLSGNNARYAKALTGPNGSYDLNAGSDGVIATRDDLRGDDINLGWFRIGVNDPFIFESVIDASTYSSDLADLPGGHEFVEIAGLQVAQLRGLPNDEAVMHQGSRFQETQRQLARDDATMIRLGMSGLDRSEGSGDDYTLVLQYGGVADDCDITIRTEGSGFGVCQVGGAFINSNHIRITSGTITMGSASVYNWFFNPDLLEDGAIFADRFESQ
jgi:hypothetical protein